jgi:hypothetical protein
MAKPRIRSIADKLTKKVEVKVGGETFSIIITHNTLIECEQLTGLNLLAGEANILKPSFTLMRALLYVALKHAGAHYTIEQVGELIHPQNLLAIQEALITAWAASMPDEDAAPGRPTQAAGE